uniref:NACHT, LRR and PYD domains-containing protein 1-like n=1 Tax=Phallusia mammillata TaxID=59560 RepID=A0A6F9DLN8_9ASCI|nr:NACHT, LRR and PYD domains-containing protein 1-like [Phallusia mammillata]
MTVNFDRSSSQAESPGVDISNFESKLNSALSEHLNKISYRQTSLHFLERKLQCVNMQISSQPQTVRQMSSQSTRAERKKIYGDCRGDINVSQIFPKALENIERLAERQTASDQGRSKFISSKCGSVLITGQAGIGKTTVAEEVAKTADSCNPESQHVIFIQLRDVNFREKTTLVDFLLKYATMGVSFSDAERKQMLDLLQTSPEKFLLILDGVDEASVCNFSEKAPKCCYNASYPIDCLLKNIMSGNILCGIKKLWTSRPQHAHAIHYDIRPSTTFQVLGLDVDAQEALGRQICGIYWNKVKAWMKQFPDLQAMCYVPVWCIMICSALLGGAALAENLKTVTHVLLVVVSCYLKSEHLRDIDVKDLTGILKLAWKGLVDGEVLFSDKHFKDAGVTDEIQQAFLNSMIKIGPKVMWKIMNGEKLRCFVHLIMQDFFASLYLIMLPSADFEREFNKIRDPANDDIVKLVFGLLNPNTIEVLNDILQQDCQGFVEDKLDFLKCVLVNQMLEQQQPMQSDDYRQIDMRSQDSLLHVWSWCKEINRDDFRDTLVDYMLEKFNFSGQQDIESVLFPSDATSFLYLMEGNQPKRFQSVLLTHTKFLGNSLDVFSKAFSRTQEIVTLDVSYSAIGSDGAKLLMQCLPQLRNLDMMLCGVDKQGAVHVADGLLNHPKGLDRLDMSLNEIGVEGAKKLFHAVGKVKELGLEECGVNFQAISSLASKAKNLPVPLDELRLSGNDLGDQSVSSFIQCLHNISTLHVRDCQITSQGKQKLTRKLQQLNSGRNHGAHTIVGIE